MPNIGDRRQDGKIYAGPDYGYQSAATYQQLEKDGAFKLGASAVRRGKQLADNVTDAITSRLPKSVKDAAKGYADRLQQSQQQQQQLEQSIITQGGVARFYYQAKQEASQRRSQDVATVSKATNIAPELISGAVSAAEMAIDARMGANAAKKGLTSYVKNMDAPVVYASGGSVKIDTSVIPGMRITKGPDGKALPGKERIFERDGKVYQWIPTETPGPKQGAYVDPVDGVVRTRRPGDTGRGYQLEEVQIGRDKEGNFVTRTVNNPREQLPTKKDRSPDKTDTVELPGGSTRKTPQSQAQYNEPAIENRLKRRHVEETIPPETYLDVEDVTTGEMPIHQVSDGNVYSDPLRSKNLGDAVENVSAKERNRQFQAGIDKRTQNAIEKRIQARKKDLDIDGLKREVFISGDDYGKLQVIANQLGVPVSKYKTPSALERALKKRISELEVTYAGKASITKEERAEIVEDIKYAAATGRTQTEVNLLNKRINDKDSPSYRGNSKASPRQQGDTRRKANTDPDYVEYSDRPQRTRKRPYGQPETTEGDFDYDIRERLERSTAKKDQEYLDKHFIYDPELKKYVPRKPNRSVSDRVNRRRRQK